MQTTERSKMVDKVFYSFINELPLPAESISKINVDLNNKLADVSIKGKSSVYSCKLTNTGVMKNSWRSSCV